MRRRLPPCLPRQRRPLLSEHRRPRTRRPVESPAEIAAKGWLPLRPRRLLRPSQSGPSDTSWVKSLARGTNLRRAWRFDYGYSGDAASLISKWLQTGNQRSWFLQALPDGRLRLFWSTTGADFPSETSAVESSVSSLSTAIQKLPSSPTPQQLAAVVPEINSTVTASQDLQSATSSACD